MKNKLSKVILLSLLTTVFMSKPAESVTTRIKDIARVQGTSDNQIIGYGLVVGLAGTGDTRRTYSTFRSVANMLRNFGVKVTPEKIDKITNSAAVIVTASLPPFAKSGDKIDGLISSIGDAKSLEGGTLLMTPLVGVDGEVYATCQGPVSIGGFNVRAGGAGRARAQRNHPVVGRVPGGVRIVRDFDTQLIRDGILNFTLDRPDFTTAQKIAQVINNRFRYNIAIAKDSRNINVNLPERFRKNLVEVISAIEELEIEPDNRAIVVISERTGTVVIGGNVKILSVAITHGDLSLTIREREVEVEEKQNLVILPEGNRIEDIVKILNALGVTPRDMIAILQAIHQAGALQAELKII